MNSIHIYSVKRNNTVLYTGVTNDLKRRVYVHKEKLADGFTKDITFISLFITRYESIISAISRENK